MEFFLSSYDGALPVEVTIDVDNGRYMIRKSDSSGEFFNTPNELIHWVKNNLREDDFCHPQEFHGMIEQLSNFETNGFLA